MERKGKAILNPLSKNVFVHSPFVRETEKDSQVKWKERKQRRMNMETKKNMSEWENSIFTKTNVNALLFSKVRFNLSTVSDLLCRFISVILSQSLSINFWLPLLHSFSSFFILCRAFSHLYHVIATRRCRGRFYIWYCSLKLHSSFCSCSFCLFFTILFCILLDSFKYYLLFSSSPFGELKSTSSEKSREKTAFRKR